MAPKDHFQLDVDWHAMCQRLPVCERPTGRLRRLTLSPVIGIDDLNYTLWENGAQPDLLYIHLVGGIAGLDVWYGPASRGEILTDRADKPTPGM